MENRESIAYYLKSARDLAGKDDELLRYLVDMAILQIGDMPTPSREQKMRMASMQFSGEKFKLKDNHAGRCQGT